MTSDPDDRSPGAGDPGNEPTRTLAGGSPSHDPEAGETVVSAASPAPGITWWAAPSATGGSSSGARSAWTKPRRRLGKDRFTAVSRIDLGLNLLARGAGTYEARHLLEDGLAVLAPEAGESDPRVAAARKALGAKRPAPGS